jgi:hypothetical protein
MGRWAISMVFLPFRTHRYLRAGLQEFGRMAELNQIFE